MVGRSTANGYGWSHQQVRADYARRMKRGEMFTCWRCGGWVDPSAPWDLGHDDHDRSIYRGPEHVACNRATKGRRKWRPRAVPRRWVL